MIAMSKRYGVDSIVTQSRLRDLELIREVNSLPGGYWIPAPARLLSIGHRRVILASQPTETLQACIGGVTSSEGLARYIDRPDMEIAHEPFEVWAEGPADTLVWTKTIVELANKSGNEITNKFESQVLTSSKHARDNEPGTRLMWQLKSLPADLPENKEWFLVRNPSPPRNYSIVRRLSKNVLLEYSCKQRNVSRLGYGLAALYNRPVHAASPNPGHLLLFGHLQLPIAEHRLMVAISKMERRREGRLYIYSPEVETTVVHAMTQLGVRVKNDNK
jgi:hypothetical protein